MDHDASNHNDHSNMTSTGSTSPTYHFMYNTQQNPKSPTSKPHPYRGGGMNDTPNSLPRYRGSSFPFVLNPSPARPRQGPVSPGLVTFRRRQVNLEKSNGVETIFLCMGWTAVAAFTVLVFVVFIKVKYFLQLSLISE